MAIYHVFARGAYADPLEYVTEVELDAPPTLDALPIGRDPAWIELVVIPDNAIRWVIRGGRLVAHEEVPHEGSGSPQAGKAGSAPSRGKA